MEAKKLLEDLVRDENNKEDDDSKKEDKSKGRRPSRYSMIMCFLGKSHSKLCIENRLV
jgi:hypothetical protein